MHHGGGGPSHQVLYAVDSQMDPGGGSMSEEETIRELREELQEERDRRDRWQIVAAVVLMVSLSLFVMGAAAWW